MAYDATYYRKQAAAAQADADGTSLDNVRDRAMRSVAAFEAIADGLDRSARRRAEAETRANAPTAEVATAPLASS